MIPKNHINDYVTDELYRLISISKLNLPKLMNQYMSFMTYRLGWKINEDVTKEQINEMSKEVLKYMKVSYMNKINRR